MCLSPSWFSEREERLRRFDENGVANEQAKEALDRAGSTAYPVAQEMAQWLSNNWTLNQIRALGPLYERLFFLALGYGRDGSKRSPNAILRSGDVIRHVYGPTSSDEEAFVAIYENGHIRYGDAKFDSPGHWLTHVRAWKFREGCPQPLTDEQAGHFDGPWWSHVSVLSNGSWRRVQDLMQ